MLAAVSGSFGLSVFDVDAVGGASVAKVRES